MDWDLFLNQDRRTPLTGYGAQDGDPRQRKVKNRKKKKICEKRKTITRIMESTKIQITKLNAVNYPIWKFKVELLLIRDGLWKVIKDDAPDPITEVWNEKDDKARATIGLLVDDNQLGYIRNSKSAKESWAILKNIHEKATMTNKIVVMRKLFSARMSENGNIDNHISEMLELFERLVSLGERFEEHIVVAVILSSLPNNYDNLITALEGRPEKELTKEFVIEKLRDDYQRKINSNKSNEMTDDCVMKISRNGSSRPKCYNCGMEGHFAKDCYKPTQNRMNAITAKHHEEDEEDNYYVWGLKPF